MVRAKAQGPHVYYWIKTDYKGNKALSLEGTLRISNFNPHDENQLFRFDVVGSNNYTIQNSSIIINNWSGKALDIPGSTFKHGERIIQWSKHKKWNQRWYIQKDPKGYVIKSAMNALVLDIAEEKRENGAKVVQWEQSGGMNQYWMP